MATETLNTPAANAPGDRRTWCGLAGAGESLAIYSAASKHDGFSLVVTDSAASAARIDAELRFFAGNAHLEILNFPDRETLPYDLFSPHQDIVSERLSCLYRLPAVSRGILIVPATTLMQVLPPVDYVLANSFVYSVGEKLAIDALRARLDSSGYHAVDTVREHGEYAVRGGLVDVYPMGSELPFRIDLLDDEIDSLRSFDPETQTTLAKQEQIRLLPAREYPLDRPGIKSFLDAWHERFDVDPRQVVVYQDVKSGHASQGIEAWLPLFFRSSAYLFDYLPPRTLAFVCGEVVPAVEQFWGEINERFEEQRVDRRRPLLPPTELFLPLARLFATLNRLPRTDIVASTVAPGATRFRCPPPTDISLDHRAANPLHRLQVALGNSGCRALFCAESTGRREALLELLGRKGIQPLAVDSWQGFIDSRAALAIVTFPLQRGLIAEELAVRLISETELFGHQVMQRRRRERARETSDLVVRNLAELTPGAPVVHIDHGVGRYQGLATLEIDGTPAEFLVLIYADDARLYVPVANLHLISRYGAGDEALAPLHRLGSDQWQKARRKAAEKVRDTAAELLEIYARRAARKGFACRDSADYEAFAADFPFEETPDQHDAIEAVRRDMLAEQPMDRLICGDVGFGKTEVAMRAAFLAVASSKQVVVLVPTTLLAQQHYDNFRDRFANWPVSVDILSRFRTAKEQEDLLRQLESGKIDILIGTHKLLHTRRQFDHLGLLIIDEEHRFGVQQKERIKALRAEVDILTLTATPIPRTLNMAMGGIRDLSIIATPPARRLSVKTFVRQREDRVIREAILREILRGGQVYFLHNEVKTIEKVTAELKQLVPEARVDYAHGQMRERQLEQVMSDFYHQRFNILVCSTIIETGIDVPSANTILIDRADKLGLAQLHQLRGRVGRSHHQAYAYLLTPEPRSITPDAVKRLEAIAAADQLGSGFTLATHDLEIRGAGELLGEEQSGHIHRIGFSLYMDMLNQAIKAIRAGRVPDPEADLGRSFEINLHLPALIPEDYLPDINGRLILYKRLASADTELELRELQVEMIDRFGLLPPAVANLVQLAHLRQRAAKLGIVRIDAAGNGGKLEFAPDTTVDPLTIVRLVQSKSGRYRFEGATVLKFMENMPTPAARLETVSHLLETLSAAGNGPGVASGRSADTEGIPSNNGAGTKAIGRRRPKRR